MLKSLSRPGTWLALILMGAGLLIAVVLGVHTFMTSTATPVHPDANQVSSIADGEPPPEWAEAIVRAQRLVRDALVEQNLAGLSVAVGAGGALVWAEGVGWADIEKRVPVEPNLGFRLGSASTVLTSAAVGMLVEKELLNLDAEIQSYVPEFPKKQAPITVRQVMAHTAGIRNDSGDESPLFAEHCERAAEALPLFAERSLLFDPGTEYRYSNYGWIVVSAAIEAVAGDPFPRVMRKQVFEPLAMDDTRIDAATDAVTDRASSYFPRYSADPRFGLDPMREIDISCYAGAGAFVSTPSDLVRFGLAMMSDTLLQPATVALFQTGQRLPSGQETGYGLGWDLETVALSSGQTAVLGHDGDVLGGQMASLMTWPARDLVVAVVSNTSYADTSGLAAKLLDAFAGGPAPAAK